MRRSMVAYLIFGAGILTLYGVGGFNHWWRGALEGLTGGSGRSFWGSGGTHGGK